jgi:hypothetical protein
MLLHVSDNTGRKCLLLALGTEEKTKNLSENSGYLTGVPDCPQFWFVMASNITHFNYTGLLLPKEAVLVFTYSTLRPFFLVRHYI